MASYPKNRLSIADFYDFAQRPENAQRHLELIDGEVVDVPSNILASTIAIRIATLITMWLMQSNSDGNVSGADGGYVIEGHVFVPDVAFYRDFPKAKGFSQTPPLLAVEVISDPGSHSEQAELRRKLSIYRNADVVVWVVDFEAKQIEVHFPDNRIEIYDESMMMPGGDILPGFELAVKDVFPEEPSDD
ncbi:MAG: hypothetical protein CL607_19780 [Anaerolineaceae bacterium]|nr:hypothetical protein [Anaerolineaceae bacterium]